MNYNKSICKFTGKDFFFKTGNKKRATCLATLLQNELNSDVARFTEHIKPVNKLICCKTDLMWLVKRATSLFKLFYSNVARQVAHFLLPFFTIER